MVEYSWQRICFRDPGVIEQIEEEKRPLYLSLLVQRFFMMDRREFETAEALASGMARLHLYMRGLLNEMPDDPVPMIQYLLSVVGQRFGLDACREILLLLAVSRAGLTERELEKILALAGIPFLPLPFQQMVSYFYDSFTQDSAGRWSFRHRLVFEAVSAGATEEEKRRITLLAELSYSYGKKPNFDSDKRIEAAKESVALAKKAQTHARKALDLLAEWRGQNPFHLLPAYTRDLFNLLALIALEHSRSGMRKFRKRLYPKAGGMSASSGTTLRRGKTGAKTAPSKKQQSWPLCLLFWDRKEQPYATACEQLVTVLHDILYYSTNDISYNPANNIYRFQAEDPGDRFSLQKLNSGELRMLYGCINIRSEIKRESALDIDIQRARKMGQTSEESNIWYIMKNSCALESAVRHGDRDILRERFSEDHSVIH